MKNEILQAFRSSADGITAIKGYRDYLSSRLEATVDKLNLITDVTARSMMTDLGVLEYIDTKVGPYDKLVFQTKDIISGQTRLATVSLRQLCVAIHEGSIGIADYFDSSIDYAITEVVSTVTDQVTAARCAIELFSTFAENSIGGFISEASNLISDYASRLSLTVGNASSTVIATSQQFVSMLFRNSGSLKERAEAVIRFFGLSETVDEEWSGVTTSPFTDITGVTPIAAFFTGLGNTLAGIVGDVIATVGVATKNVLLAILGIATKVFTSVFDTLSGRHDAFDKSLLSIGKDLSITDYGCTIAFEMDNMTDWPHGFVADSVTYMDKVGNIQLINYALSHDGTVIGELESTIVDRLKYAISYVDPDYSSEMTLKGLRSDCLFHLIMWCFHLSKSIVRPFNPIRFLLYMKAGVYSYLADWVDSVDHQDVDDLNKFFSGVPSGFYRDMYSLLDVIHLVVSGFNPFTDFTKYHKVPTNSYLKVRLIGAYMYMYQKGSQVFVRLQWIPMNPKLISPNGVDFRTYDTSNTWFTSSDTFCIDVNRDFITLPEANVLSSFSDFDFGDPSSDQMMYKWVLNAKLMTLMQLYMMGNNVASVPRDVIGEMLSSISAENWVWDTRKIQNTDISGFVPYYHTAYYPTTWLSSANISNLMLAELCCGFYKHETSSIKHPTADVVNGFKVFIDSISQQSGNKEENFIPYYITPDIQKGSYTIRTDTANAMIAGAAVAALLIATVGVVSLIVVKSMRKKSYMAQAKADQLAFKDPSDKTIMKDAWKAQKKANIIAIITDALSSSTSSAMNAATGCTLSTAISTAKGQIDQAIASELNLSTEINAKTTGTEELITRLVVG